MPVRDVVCELVQVPAVAGLDLGAPPEDVLELGHQRLLGVQAPVQAFQLVAQLEADVWKEEEKGG